MSISLEEAKEMMDENSYSKLRDLVSVKPTINTSHKMNNDILMQALCRAVSNDIIHTPSLDDKMIKLLNSATNSISQSKLTDILKRLNQHQPIKCVVSVLTPDMSSVMQQWEFKDEEVDFNDMFQWVVENFEITPSVVRSKMVDTLKPTIVNNIAQLVGKYYNTEDKSNIKVSINTINRLVNMRDHLLFAEFMRDE